MDAYEDAKEVLFAKDIRIAEEVEVAVRTAEDALEYDWPTLTLRIRRCKLRHLEPIRGISACVFLQRLELDFSGNLITGTHVRRFHEVARLPNLRSFSLMLLGNEIGSEGTRRLADTFFNMQLRTFRLGLQWNDIGDQGCVHLAGLLDKWTNREKNLKKAKSSRRSTAFGGQPGSPKAGGGGGDAELVELEYLSFYLGMNNISDQGCIALARAINQMPTLKHVSLNLVHNHVHPPACDEIAEGILSKHGHLRGLSLDLFHTAVGAHGSIQLLKAAREQPSLTFLALDLGIHNTTQHPDIITLAAEVLFEPQDHDLRFVNYSCNY
jgi:hypothetical protein